jgi:hypothetical protein
VEHWECGGERVAELEERVERLEGELVEVKASIKDLLIELKVLMARGQNPLADLAADNQAPARNSPVIVVAPLV